MKNYQPTSFRIILSVILVLISLSFSNQKKGKIAYTMKVNGSEVVVCPVNKVTDTIDLRLSSLLESCEIIKLQNTPEALFDRAWHTVISDKYICIKPYGQQPAKLYDKKGMFLRNIGKLGRGPGEYQMLNGLQFNQNGDMLFLLPFATSRKILVYDVSGKQLKDIPLACTQRKFKAFFSPDSVVTVLSMPFPGDSAICFTQDFRGKLIQKVPPPDYLINKSFDGEVFTNYLTPEYDLYNTATDTLYHYNINRNKLEPKFTKDFGGRKVVTTSREIPGYYYFWFRGENIGGNILVNQKTLDAKYFRLKNDYFGNIAVSPVFSNGYFINSVAAITLKKQIAAELKRKDISAGDKQKLIEFDKNLKEDDNNIIFYGKLKKI